jgi:hypothetical protein
LEKYNPIKNKHQQNAKVAPSTEKEVNSRGLFNPFKSESIKLGNLTLSNIIDKIKQLSSGLIFLKLPNNYCLFEFDNYNYSINKIKNYQLITIY